MFIDFCLIAGMSFLGLLIFFLIKQKAGFSKKLLIVFFTSAFFFLLYYYGYLHRSRPIGAIAILFGHGVGYLLGPMILYLLKSIIFPKEQLVKPMMLNLIPFFAIFLCVNIPLSVAMATDYFTSFHKFYNNTEGYFNLTENVFFAVYLVFTWRFLLRIEKIFQENYSALDKNNLDWYRYLIIGFIVIIVTDSACTVYEFFFDMIEWNIGTIIALIYIAMYLYLGYKGMFQAQILMPDFLLDKISGKAPEQEIFQEPEVSVTESPVKMVTGQLDSFSVHEIDGLKSKLLSLLENDKVFLNEELSLTELSDKMGISNKKLSELLNKYLNTSFYDLVNDYRIGEVKRRLDAGDAEKYTMVSIAYDSGFQSKASFYRIFKNREGISPTDYRKKMLEKKI